MHPSATSPEILCQHFKSPSHWSEREEGGRKIIMTEHLKVRKGWEKLNKTLTIIVTITLTQRALIRGSAEIVTPVVNRDTG
jgi:hypothetical protein